LVSCGQGSAPFAELVELAAKGSVAAEGAATYDRSEHCREACDGCHESDADGPRLMERLQRELPEARFVQAFNPARNRRMVEPLRRSRLSAGIASRPYAGALTSSARNIPL
jgi:hypothetical protein